MEGKQVRRRGLRRDKRRLNRAGDIWVIDSFRGNRQHCQSYRVSRWIGFHEVLERLCLARSGVRWSLMTGSISMAAILSGRHLRTSQAVAEKQRDYRQDRRSNGNRSHFRLDYRTPRWLLTITSFADICEIDRWRSAQAAHGTSNHRTKALTASTCSLGGGGPKTDAR